MDNSGKAVAIIAAVASIAGGLVFVLVLTGLWPYVAAGGALLASGVLGLAGALAGWSARHSANAGLARFALRLGLSTALAVGLAIAFLTPAAVETSGPVEVRPA